MGMGAAWGDADGDGWLDLAVTGYEVPALLFSKPKRHMVPEIDRSPAKTRRDTGPAPSWADFDNWIGDLDLYVTVATSGMSWNLTSGRGVEVVATVRFAAVPYTLNPASFEPELEPAYSENDGRRPFRVRLRLSYGVSEPHRAKPVGPLA